MSKFFDELMESVREMDEILRSERLTPSPPFHRKQTTKPRCRLSKNKPATTRYAARITWPAFISRAATPTAPMPTSRFLRVSQPSKSIVKTKTD